MKNAVVLSFLSATVAVVSAQDNATQPCLRPNAAFCAGDSLKTDIIIRCDSEGRGQAGRCSDVCCLFTPIIPMTDRTNAVRQNLAGEPPVGDTPALCWQTDGERGDAACEKNCVVFGSSGNANGTFTLPPAICTPSRTANFTALPTKVIGGGGTGVTGLPTPSPNRTTVSETSIGPVTKIGGATGQPIPPTRTAEASILPTRGSGARAKANTAAGALALVGLAAVYLL